MDIEIDNENINIKTTSVGVKINTMNNYLMKTGLFKTTKQADYFLVGLSILVFLLGIYLIFSNTSSNKAYTGESKQYTSMSPEEQSNLNPRDRALIESNMINTQNND